MQIVSNRIPLDGTNRAGYPAPVEPGVDSTQRRVRGAAGFSIGTNRDASMTTMTAPSGALARGIAACGAALALAALLAPSSATAQDKGTLNPQPLPPLAKSDDPATPAKELFGRKTAPAPLQARTIGFYSKGCLAGAVALPIDGPTWQVMRLSRNRNWGHPSLIRFLERYAPKASQAAHWPGLLIGDLSQPRGGPALSGHASHQVGLDVDVWLTPMKDY